MAVAAAVQSTVSDTLLKLVGPDSPLRNVIMALATLVILVYLHKVTRGRLARYLKRQAHRPENADVFLRGYDIVYKILMAILVLAAAGGSFPLLGLSVAFLGTVLGWSLQVPIRGLAAWVMVLLKRPFRIGDRISVAGVTGDVTDIQLNHIILNQVGGTVAGEERSGRGILIPNAMLFDNLITNYNYFAKEDQESSIPPSRFMLDEVLVRVTFGSDQALARRLCVEAAQEALDEIVGGSEEKSFTRSEFLGWGILLRVRYQTIPARRAEASSRVTQLIWESFNRNRDRVQFCMPVSTADVVRMPEENPPPMAPQGLPAE